MSKIEAILFLVLLTVYSFFVQYPNVNQNSRLDLVMAMATEGTVRIDSYHENTIDKSLYEGHYYSDKAPGLSFLGLPAYLGLRALQPIGGAAVWPGYAMWVVNCLAVAAPGALLAVLLYRWLRAATGRAGWALAVAVALGLGTLILPYATMFFGHVTAAACAFAAFYLLWAVRRGRRGDGALAAAGLLAGAAFLVEYPLALVAGLLTLYALAFLGDRRRLAFFLIGMAPPLLALLVYNTAAFGAPLRLSYWYSVATPTPGLMRQGLLGAGLPSAWGLWEITVGPRGLFRLAPLLLLALPGLWAMARRREMRLEAALFALICLGFALSSAGFFNPIGGGGPGPRFLIPALPFLAASIGFALPRWRYLFVVLAALSVAIMLLATFANPQAPMTVADPLRDYWLPAVQQRSVVMTSAYLRFGLRSILSGVFLLATLAIGALSWFVWQQSQTSGARSAGTVGAHSAALGVCLALAFVTYLALGFPIDLRAPFVVPTSMLGVTP